MSMDAPKVALFSYTRSTLVLAIGDGIAFLAFAAAGRNTHAEAAGFDAIPQIIETAAPFMIGWFLVAPMVGAYRADVTNNPKRMLARSALAWLIAWPIGLGLRALIRQSSIPISFALVALVVVLAIVGIWRLAFALVARRAVQP
jgi:hypothetical protein